MSREDGVREVSLPRPLLMFVWVTCLFGGFAILVLSRQPLSSPASLLWWGIPLILEMPMLYILLHNMRARRRGRALVRRYELAMERHEREHPPRLDRFPAAYVDEVRAVVRAEFHGVPDFKRKEDRMVDLYCSVVEEALRHLDEFTWDDLIRAGRNPDKAMLQDVTGKLFAARRLLMNVEPTAPGARRGNGRSAFGRR